MVKQPNIRQKKYKKAKLRSGKKKLFNTNTHRAPTLKNETDGLKQQETGSAAHEDKTDRIYVVSMLSYEGVGEKPETNPKLPRVTAWAAEVISSAEQQGGSSKQADYGRSESQEDVADDRVVLVLHQKAADDNHKNQAGENDRECRHARAEYASPCRESRIDYGHISDIGGRVYANRARCHLADGHNVRELSGGEPVVVMDDIALDHGQHGITAAKTEKANLEESDEKLQEYHVDYFINCP